MKKISLCLLLIIQLSNQHLVAKTFADPNFPLEGKIKSEKNVENSSNTIIIDSEPAKKLKGIHSIFLAGSDFGGKLDLSEPSDAVVDEDIDFHPKTKNLDGPYSFNFEIQGFFNNNFSLGCGGVYAMALSTVYTHNAIGGYLLTRGQNNIKNSNFSIFGQLNAGMMENLRKYKGFYYSANIGLMYAGTFEIRFGYSDFAGENKENEFDYQKINYSIWTIAAGVMI